MDIIVCVKVLVNNVLKSKNNCIGSSGPLINPYDMKAIEMAVLLKEKYGARVTVISMAPLIAKNNLKMTKYLGVDEIILISDKDFAGSDTYATSKILSEAIKRIKKYDLIICGKKTMDGETAQVGGAIAAALKLPCISYVDKIYEIIGDRINVSKKTDCGKVVIEVKFPILITVEDGICESRYASLRELVKHKNYEPQIWSNKELSLEADCIGLKGSPTQVVAVYKSEYKSKCKIINEREVIDVFKILI